jgi:hypothetical protein
VDLLVVAEVGDGQLYPKLGAPERVVHDGNVDRIQRSVQKRFWPVRQSRDYRTVPLPVLML